MTHDILEGLEYLHKKGIVHGDIKADNIVLCNSEDEDEYPVAKLCDFGLCHVINPKTGKTKVDYVCGTKGYLAPELLEVTINSLKGI